MKTNTDHGRLLRRTTAGGLVLLLILAGAPVAEAGVWVRRDWSRVQTVAPGTRTTVRLYKDQAPWGKRKIKGYFHSATDKSVTLTLGHGQTRTLRKRAVRQVLIYRPFKKRYQGWLTAGVITAILAGAAAGAEGSSEPVSVPIGALGVGLVVGVPTAVAFLVALRWGGIYNVPPARRDPSSTGTKPPRNRSSATVREVTESGESSTDSGTEGDSLLEQSTPDQLRQQARQALVRKCLPLDLPDLTVKGLSSERTRMMQTVFDIGFLGANGASWRSRFDRASLQGPHPAGRRVTGPCPNMPRTTFTDSGPSGGDFFRARRRPPSVNGPGATGKPPEIPLKKASQEPFRAFFEKKCKKSVTKGRWNRLIE